MAQFTESLCREVIRTQGRCGLTRNEIVQLAWIALRTLEREPKGVLPSANDSPDGGPAPSTGCSQSAAGELQGEKK